jgi:Tfp pilus assembly protein PilF
MKKRAAVVAWMAVLLVIALLAARVIHRPPPRPRRAWRFNRATDFHQIALARAAQGDSFLTRDPDQAAQYFKDALELEPKNRTYLQGLATALHGCGRTAEAIPIWKSLARGDDLIGKDAARALAEAGTHPAN